MIEQLITIASVDSLQHAKYGTALHGSPCLILITTLYLNVTVHILAEKMKFKS